MEKEKERSAADRFCFCLREEEETGCFQESLRSWTPPTERRRGEGMSEYNTPVCFSLSLSVMLEVCDKAG